MRVLLIEPDHATAQSIELMLKADGFNVYTTDLVEEGVDLAKIYDYDLILTETKLPDGDGVNGVRLMRQARVNTPVIVLTGDASIENLMRCFKEGVDDWLKKPFHRDELVCRMRAVIRRAKGHAQAIIHTGELAINLDGKVVTRGDRPVHLTGKEYQIFELLSLRKGTTQTKEALMNHLYGGMDEPELKIVDVFICKLRKKLGESGRHIETVWGRGYRLVDAPMEKLTVDETAAMTLEEKARGQLASARGRVLQKLAEMTDYVKSGTIAALLQEETSAIAAGMHVAVREGQATIQGGGRWTTYMITDLGRAWLAERGWVAPERAETAAAA
jgi:two-component system cell cycle response regulator CtrA